MEQINKYIGEYDYETGLLERRSSLRNMAGVVNSKQLNPLKGLKPTRAIFLDKDLEGALGGAEAQVLVHLLEKFNCKCEIVTSLQDFIYKLDSSQAAYDFVFVDDQKYKKSLGLNFDRIFDEIITEAYPSRSDKPLLISFSSDSCFGPDKKYWMRWCRSWSMQDLFENIFELISALPTRIQPSSKSEGLPHKERGLREEIWMNIAS